MQIELNDVIFSYEKKSPTISDVSFSVNKGEYISIVGKNGSGKSTLAKLLNALLIPDSGEVIVDSESSADKNSQFNIRKKIGVVFQNPDNQLVASIIEDDVAFGPENLGVKREEIGERVDFALSAVNMSEFKRVSPERLSGGQKQRIAIAGVLALKPDVLVLDESTSMLDPKGRKEVLGIAEKLNKENGTTIIAVTHYMDEVLLADRVLVMHKGKIVMSGSPKEIFSREEELKAYGLEIPAVSKIAKELKKAGVKIKDGIMTKDELAEALCELL